MLSRASASEQPPTAIEVTHAFDRAIYGVADRARMTPPIATLGRRLLISLALFPKSIDTRRRMLSRYIKRHALCRATIEAPVVSQGAESIGARTPITVSADSRLVFDDLRHADDTESNALPGGLATPARAQRLPSRRRDAVAASVVCRPPVEAWVA